MMTTHFSKLSTVVCQCLFAFLGLAIATNCYANEKVVRRNWKIDGASRQALLYIPTTAQTTAAPILFAFHGHSGTAEHAARTWKYQTLWPEAIVVYMQGLPTPGRLTDPTGERTGWQMSAGAENDRDLRFFDAVLADLEKDYRVDKNRIYATGHSNGGSFTYLLWQTRAPVFAAFAPSAAVLRSLFSGKTDDGVKRTFIPKPVLAIAGENDTLVKFAWQEKMIEALRQHNQCGAGQSWSADKRCMLYPSPIGAPVITYIHPGTHVVPTDAPAMVVKFFQEYSQAK